MVAVIPSIVTLLLAVDIASAHGKVARGAADNSILERAAHGKIARDSAEHPVLAREAHGKIAREAHGKIARDAAPSVTYPGLAKKSEKQSHPALSYRTLPRVGYRAIGFTA
jgi:hypothetical protein